MKAQRGSTPGHAINSVAMMEQMTESTNITQAHGRDWIAGHYLQR